MAATFAGKLARKTPEHETEPAESTQSPETVSAAPRYLQPGFSAGDPPPSPLVRSQIALQTKLTINQPGDVYEQEADRVAAQVMSAPGPRVASGPQQVMRKTTEEEKEEEEQAREGHVQTKRASGSGAPAEAPAAVNQTISSSGQPLEPDTRAYMEERFGQDFSGVQIHTDSQAAQSASEIGAEAYTVGSHIAFNEGRYAPGTSQGDMLIAHELTHYVQQSGQSAAVQSPEGGVAVQQYASDEFVQRLAIPDWVLDQLPDAVANLAREIEAAGGIFAYIENLMSGIVERVFGGLERGANTVAELIEAFTTLYTTIPIISISIASGNREMFTEAVNNLANALQTIVGHAWDALDTLLGPVRDFLNGVVATLDQPIEQWIESVGGTIWATIIDIGRNIWNWTADIRESTLGGPIWSEIRDFLDITGPDTYDGLVNWIEEQAAAVWSGIKDQLSGVITSIQETAATINDVISVENITTLREVVDGWITTARDFILALNSDDGNGITSQQELLRTVLIPMLQSGAAALRDLVIGAGTWVAGLIASLAEKVTGFIATIAANSLLGAVIPELFAWVTEAINSLSEWAQNIVVGLFNAIGDTIAYLSDYIEPFLTTLINLVTATTDLVGSLPNLLTAAWEAIPAWIRDPIKNFILDQVLARIPIFGELVRNPDVWARVQATAMQILQQIFVSGDLVGAAWTFFQALLELLNFPTELVVQIISKAAAVFTQIFEDPVGFLLNLLGAVKQGFTQFFGNILNHLLTGVTDWLLGQAAEAGIQPPSDLSLGSIFQFVLDILGISMDLIWERLALKIGEERVAQIRTAINVLTGAWEWISIAINEGPGALWERIQSQISQLWDTILNAAIEWITMTIIERVTVRLLSMLDPTGIMAVVNSLIALYSAIESFIQYITQMLEIVNTVLDGIGQIAAGVLDTAANYLEGALADVLPIAIGFLANQVGLGGLGRRLGEIIQTVRGYVVQGIDWLIDQAMRIGQAALNMLGLGGGGGDAAAAAPEAPPDGEGVADVEQPVNMSGESHTLHYNEANGRFSLVLQSDPIAVNTFLASRAQDPNLTAAQRDAINDAQTLITQIGNITTPASAPGPALTPQDIENQVAPLLTQLSLHLGTLTPPGSTEQAVPPMVFTPGFSSNRAASAVRATYIYNGPGNHNDGSEPQQGSMTQAQGTLQALNISRKWVRFHILNANLGGVGIDSNLIPTPIYVNNAYARSFERSLKDKYRNNKVVWMEATFGYRDGVFVTSFNANGGAMVFNATTNQWEPDPAEAVPTFSSTIPDPYTEEVEDGIYINVLYQTETGRRDRVFQRAMRHTNFFASDMRNIFNVANTVFGLTSIDSEHALIEIVQEYVRYHSNIPEAEKPQREDELEMKVRNADFRYEYFRPEDVWAEEGGE